MVFARRTYRGFSVAYYDCDGQAISPHFHDQFVISINTHGKEISTVGRNELRANERDILIYNPAEIQSAHSVTSEWKFFSIYIDASFLYDICKFSSGTIFEKHLLTHQDLSESIITSLKLSLQSDTNENEASECVINAIHGIISNANSMQPAISKHTPQSLGQVSERLVEDPSSATLSDLALDVGLTPVQLVRKFTRAYGLPPFAWANIVRLQRSLDQLDKGEPLALIAAGLGYTDQSHFTRRFRKMYGVTPGVWRRGSEVFSNGNINE